MEGDATLFAREDYVEEAWRIVDLVLKADTPIYEYEPNTWGPNEAERRDAGGTAGAIHPSATTTSRLSRSNRLREQRCTIRILRRCRLGRARSCHDDRCRGQRGDQLLVAAFVFAVSGGHTPWMMLRVLVERRHSVGSRASRAGR